MPELERWVLHRLSQIDEKVRATADSFDLHDLYMELHNFCAVDLSAFYFDIRKDSLYCDAPDGARRRSVRTVLHAVLSRLTSWLAPVLVFTAEEAWRARPWAEGEASVHLRTHPETPAAWRDDALAAKWDKVREIRRVVTGALELARADKKIGASLQAHPVVHLTPERRAMLDGVDLSEISITSGITFSEAPAANGAFTLAEIPGVAVLVNAAEGGKCDRCWQVLPEVGSHAHHPTLCNRCAGVVGGA